MKAIGARHRITLTMNVIKDEIDAGFALKRTEQKYELKSQTIVQSFHENQCP